MPLSADLSVSGVPAKSAGQSTRGNGAGGNAQGANWLACGAVVRADEVDRMHRWADEERAHLRATYLVHLLVGT